MNIDGAKLKVSDSELGKIKDEYPQMVQNFEEVKRQAYQPQVQDLRPVRGQQTQSRGKFFEQEKWQDEGQSEGQGQTS